MGAEWPGFCSICEGPVTFRSHGPWHRDELVCETCGSIPRQRALMSVLSIVWPTWRDARIWEVAPAGPSSDKLRTECPGYVSSHYWPDVSPGALVDGVRCEDLERPTFPDASFDIVCSSDVFEHVIDVDVALAQVARVLDTGGVHVWTTPQYRDKELSKPRVMRSASGGLDHLVPPEYHGDPVCADGALVTYDWGRDLPEKVETASGMWTSVFALESRSHGLLGEFLEVFVSHKGAIAGVAADTAREIKARDETIAGLQRAVVATQASADAYREVVTDMEGSNSWRLTRPLRALRGAFRRNR